jgi:hypothetical protein
VRDFENYLNVRDHALDAQLRSLVAHTEHAKQLEAARAFMADHQAEVNAEAEARFRYLDEKGEDLDRRAARFSTAIKAFYFFVRALQDACYCVLIEAHHEKGGPGSTMTVGMKHNVYGAIVREQLPQYAEWFERLRGIRNLMKNGVTTGGAYETDGRRLARVSIWRMNDNPRQQEQHCQLSLIDVEEAVRNSADLLELAARTVKARPRQMRG